MFQKLLCCIGEARSVSEVGTSFTFLWFAISVTADKWFYWQEAHFVQEILLLALYYLYKTWISLSAAGRDLSN